jgi:hypothetical protein
MAVTAVVQEGIGRGVVLVLGKAAVVLAGNHHRNAIVVCHMDPIELHCQCSNSRRRAHLERRTGCWGTDSILGVV